MDNIKVWNKVLTPAQAYAEYAETNAYFVPTGGTGPTWKNYPESPDHPKAIDFDGTNDVARIPHSTALNLGNSGESYSVGLWFKADGVALPHADGMIGKRSDTAGLPAPFMLSIGGNNTVVAQAGSVANFVAITSKKTNLNDNHWHHTEMVRSNNTLSLYIDGMLDTSTTGTIGDGRTTAQVTIGSYSEAPAATEFFNGQLDNVKIYNYARSDAEIKTDYNNPCPGGCGVKLGAQITADGMPSPAGYWKFDDGSGQVAIDSSPNNNDGTLGSATGSDTNDPTWTESGQATGALVFDATNDYVIVDSSSSLNDLSSMSISAWIYPETIGEGGIAGWIVHKASFTAPSNGWQFYTLLNDNLGFEADFDGPGDSDLVVYSAAGSLPLSTWSHVVVTWDGSASASNVHMYLNGGELTKDTATDGVGSRVTDAAQDLQIGTDSGTNFSFDGTIDELKVYEAVLSQEQIMLDYNNKKPVLELKMNENAGEVAYNSQGAHIPKNPLGWWKMDEATSGNCTGTVSDFGSGGNNGTCQNTIPYATGKIGGSLNFDGTADYVDLGSATDLDGATSMTVSAWIYKEEDGNFPTHDGIFARGTTVQRTPWIWGNLGTQTLQTQFETTTGGISDCNVASGTITANAWSHVALRWDGSTCQFYVNGTTSGSSDTTTGNTLVNTDGSNFIGYINGFDYWNGKADNVKIWNSALTPQQIYAEYAETNAYFQNMDAATDWVVSPSGRALDFDGSNDFLDIQDSAQFETSQLTVEAWVRPETQGAWERIVWKSRGTGEIGWGLRIRDANKPGAWYYNSAGTKTAVYAVNAVLNNNQWQHLAFTYDGSTFKLYLNGQQIETQSDSDTPGNVDSTLRVGAKSATEYLFDGQIDDVKMYNYARSADEVKTDFNNGVAKFN
jgi:hypothetical protein